MRPYDPYSEVIPDHDAPGALLLQGAITPGAVPPSNHHGPPKFAVGVVAVLVMMGTGTYLYRQSPPASPELSRPLGPISPSTPVGSDVGVVPSPGRVMTGACGSATADVVAAAVGEPVAAGEAGFLSNDCKWSARSGDGNTITLEAARDPGLAKVPRTARQAPVAGIGEYALIDSAQNNRLVFVQNNVMYTITYVDNTTSLAEQLEAERRLATTVAPSG